MTGAATALLAAAVAFAVADWVVVSPPVSARRIEYVAKPATTALLIAAGIALEPADPAQRTLFVAALVFSLAGDVLLMLPSDRFTAGLGSFLAAHIAYAAGFARDVSSGPLLGLGVALVVLGFGPVAARLSAAARALDRRLGVAVGAYAAAIGAMTVTAIASADATAAAGAVLFATSDTLIGWNRFIIPIPWVRPVIMATYHVAQALLVLSLAG